MSYHRSRTCRIHCRDICIPRQPLPYPLRGHSARRTVDNNFRGGKFSGYPEGVSGPTLMDDLRRQALRFGADIKSGSVTEVDFSKRPFEVTVNGADKYYAHTVIIATGASARYLGLPDEQKYMGMGVSACATCDGFFYRGKNVAVVGGGDSACEEALYLSNIAKKVFLIVRKPALRASKVMQQRVLKKKT